MRRIYIIVGILLLILSFYGGYLLGTSGEVHIELAEVLKERDSLTVIIDRSLKNAELHKIAAAKAKKSVHQADSALQAERTAQAKKRGSAGKKIAFVVRLNEYKLDSTIIALYPDSTRLSFNRSLRPLTISGWRAAALVQDRYKLDSVADVAYSLQREVDLQAQSIDTRDRYIGELDRIISNKDTTITSVLAREKTHVAESKAWEQQAKKYKRQRNGVIVGAAVVVLAVTVKTFFNPKP